MRRKRGWFRFVLPAALVGAIIYLAHNWTLQHGEPLPPNRIPPISDPVRDAYDGLPTDFRAMVPLIEFASMFQRIKDLQAGEAPKLLDAQATEPSATSSPLARFRVEEAPDKANAEYEFARAEGAWKLLTYTHDLRKRPPPTPALAAQAPEPAARPPERKAVPSVNPAIAAAPKTVGPSISPGTGPRTYVIQLGDRLETISRQSYGTSRHWRRILEANPGLDPRRLNIGRRIVIPAPPEQPPEHPQEPEAAPDTSKH